jgi:pyruvate dehydrogenase E2 component (dihydrolipoamide acetyltransferase)
MANEFKLPELGENIESIQVAKVLVTQGDTVAVDQPVLELETDKATIEVPSSVAGTVEAVHVSEGDEIEVGQVVMTFGGGAASESVADAEVGPPPEGQSGSPGGTGSVPSEGAPDTEVSAPAQRQSGSPGGTGSVQSAHHEESMQSEGQPQVFESSVAVPAAPSVRRFAREIGLDINTVQGSGPSGRVSIDDVKRHAREKSRAAAAAGARVPTVASVIPALPDFTKWGEVETEKMSTIRRKTADHMALCWQQIPHVTIHDSADISALEPLRKRYADRAEALGGKLTMAVMVCKAVASALKAFPKFNASIDMAAHRTIYKKYVNLGVAVSTDRGLVVPVIRDADHKNMVEIAAEITKIAKKARSGKIEMSDIEGGTFTVTNLGRVGGSHFTPIINYPEVAILGMGRTFLEAAPDQDKGDPRLMLPLSLSFDHRLIDGAEAAKFLGWIIEAIEEPLVLALEG